MVHAPSISPSMWTPTRAVSKLQSSWPIVGTHTVSRPVASCCRSDTIPTPSSLRVATCASSSLWWRPRSHEVPCDLSEDLNGRTQSDSSGRAIQWSRCWMDQSLPGPRVCPPPRRQIPLQLCAQLAELRALVGERSSYRRDYCGGPHRIDSARLPALPVQPATSAFCFHHQRPRGLCRSPHPQ